MARRGREPLWRALTEGVIWLLVALVVGAIMFALVYFGRQAL